MAEREKLPISVLIVDDESSIVEQLSIILSRRVEVLYTASNGEEGFECYKDQAPDLIISDIDMPIMNGIEFLKKVRANDREIPFILSTGLKSLDVLIEAIQHGITAFLPKPLQIQALIARLEDVAHTKILEYEVEKSSLLLDQYKKIVDDSVMVSKTDTKGNITYVNEKFCNVSGYTREELVGQPHNIVRDPSMPASVFKEVWNTIQSGQIWHGILHNKSKNGNRYTVKSTIAPIMDNHGKITEYMALREDVTELHKAQEDAKLAAKIKGDFLANMSHEIRTPMNGILGFTDLLARSSLNEQQKRYIGIIRNSTKTLLGIVNDVLDFSKIESGKFELDRTNINPMIEFDNIAQLFITMMDEKNISFEIDFDPKLPESISIDLLRVQQIISNLLSNAVKFTPEQGHITFYVTLMREGEIRIGVKDTGIGITPAQQKKIFEAFSQADNSITRQFGGTGLGLTISSHLVSLMGSRLQVESEEGKGSHFYFDLKINMSDSPLETAVIMQQKPIQQLTGNVLVAEDNEVNQILIEEYLSQYGLDFMIVENGQEVLDELQKNGYDLLLMDINMPVMSGIETIKIMKEEGLSIPVIALTANAMEGDQEKFLGYGFDGYLPKPIHMKDFNRILETYLMVDQNEENSVTLDKNASVSAVPSGGIVNMKLLKEELSLPESIIRKLLEAFLKSLGNNLLELKEAVDENDFKRIEQTAHKVKGSAGNMRFYVLENLCGEIEALARSQTQSDYEGLFHTFKEMIERIQKEITDILSIHPKDDHEHMD